MEFSRPEYWRGQPFSSPGDLPNPGIELRSLPHWRRILYQLSHKGSPRIWSGQPKPSPGDLPDPGMELRSPALPADSLPPELWGKPITLVDKALMSSVTPDTRSAENISHHTSPLSISCDGHMGTCQCTAGNSNVNVSEPFQLQDSSCLLSCNMHSGYLFLCNI